MVGSGGRHAEEDREAPKQRQHTIALRLLPPQLLQFLELVGIVRRQIPGLREVVGQIVQLPDILLRVVHSRCKPLERLR